MPSETVPPRPSAPFRHLHPPLPAVNNDADALRGFAHIVVDFTAQARSFLAPHVDVTDPTSVACFVSKLASHPISTDVGHLLSGPFKDLLTFANLFIPSSSPPSQTTNIPPGPAQDTPPRSQPRSFLDALVANMPTPAPRPHTQLPRLLPGQPAPSDNLQPDTYQLSRRGTSSLQRAAIATCGHEEKGFAAVKTATNAPPLRHPANLRHVFREGRAPGTHVVFPTHDPRILLVCGPKSALPLLQTAYNRARDFTRARGCMLLPPIEISPVADLCRSRTRLLTRLISFKPSGTKFPGWIHQPMSGVPGVSTPLLSLTRKHKCMIALTSPIGNAILTRMNAAILLAAMRTNKHSPFHRMPWNKKIRKKMRTLLRN